MTRARLVWPFVTALLFAACGSSTSTAPSGTTPATLILDAAPNPATSDVCSGCGSGSTDREVQTALTIRETAGVGVGIDAIDMTLRDQATNGVIASGTFDAAAVTQLAGTSRIPARGTLIVRCSVHYPAAQAGAAASFMLTVRATDERGNRLSPNTLVTVPRT